MKTYFELITEMSKSDLQELESRIVVLMEHLLKIGHVTGQVAHDNSRGWNQTVRNQRRDLAAHIKANPGLKSKLTEQMLDKVYRIAVANVKTEYRTTSFSSSRQLSLEDVVGPEIVLALKR
jgi:hypothetical protein